MSEATFNLCKDVGVTGKNTFTCMPAAFDSIAERRAIKVSTYLEYDQYIDDFDKLTVTERSVRTEGMYERVAKDLGCKTTEWVFERALSERSLDEKLSRLLGNNMMIAIDIVHPEMFVDVRKTVQKNISSSEYAHSLGVTPILKGRNSKNLYKLTGSWVPDELRCEHTSEYFFRHLYQSYVSPYITRKNRINRYDGANITALPRR